MLKQQLPDIPHPQPSPSQPPPLSAKRPARLCLALPGLGILRRLEPPGSGAKNRLALCIEQRPATGSNTDIETQHHAFPDLTHGLPAFRQKWDLCCHARLPDQIIGEHTELL